MSTRAAETNGMLSGQERPRTNESMGWVKLMLLQGIIHQHGVLTAEGGISRKHMTQHFFEGTVQGIPVLIQCISFHFVDIDIHIDIGTRFFVLFPFLSRLWG